MDPLHKAKAIVLLQVLRAFGSVELEPAGRRLKLEVSCGRQTLRKLARELPGGLDRYRFPEFVRGYEQDLYRLVREESAVDQGTV